MKHLLCLIEDNEGKGKIYAKGENNNYQCGIYQSTGYSNNIVGRFVDTLTQCTDTAHLNFKSIYANKDFSAAITVDNKLYIWGLLDKNNYKRLSIKSPLFVKNSLKTQFVFDKIYLGYNKLFAIVKIFENENYIKKIISLEEDKDNSEDNDYDYYYDTQKNPYILNEVIIFNKKEENSRIMPIKLCIGENKVYVLCVNENNLLKEINNNKISDKGEISMNIYIEKNNKENNDMDNIEKIYNSENLNNFMKVFNSFSDINIQKTVQIFDNIEKEKNIYIDDITYDKFLQNFKKENEKDDLFLFFKENKNNEGEIIFKLIKIKISLLKLYFEQLIYSDSSSEGIKNKILLNNHLYLPENIRIQYFNSFLEGNALYYGDHYIKIDRFKANNFYDKFNENSEKIPDVELNQTIFGQLFNYFKSYIGEEFRIRKNERLFRVDLQGEQAIDAGGPYHETISLMCVELQSDYLDLFIKTPNNKTNLGELRDKYIVNPNANKNIYKNAYEFLGKFMGMAIYSGEALSLNLHPIVWKSILENKIDFEEYKTIDLSIYNLINELEEGLKKKDKNIVKNYDLYFVIQNSNNSDAELIENGKTTKVTLENLDNYINLVKSTRINEISAQIESIKKGIYSVIDKNILQILNWLQLEEMVCGKNKLDINDFKLHTHYSGYTNNDKIIKWFWEWLEKIEEKKQFKYLKFVSGRTRLPKPGTGSTYTHTITKVSIDNILPRAATCFFTLKLPNYDSKELFIENCSDITDH